MRTGRTGAGLRWGTAVLAVTVRLAGPACAQNASVSASNPASNVASAFARSANADGFIDFSFEQVEVAAFARLVGEITGRRFVVAPDVKGRVTIVSPRVARRDVFALFASVLESAGCGLVADGDLFRVVALPARPGPVTPVVGAGDVAPAAGLVTKIFRLENITAEGVRKVVESRVPGGKGGGVTVVEETNHLIVTDTVESLRLIERLIGELDRPGLARVTEIVPLKHAGAEDLATQLNLTLADRQSAAEQLRRRLPAQAGATPATERAAALVIPAAHANSLILVGASNQVAALRQLIARMDVDATAGRGRLNAIMLRHIAAEDAAKSLDALLAKTRAIAGREGAATARDIAIEASVPNNALLVYAAPNEFDVVRRLVEQLDVPREQVHIAVTIVEISGGEDFNLGVEMAALDLPGAVGSTVVQGGSLFNTGTDGLLNQIQSGVFPRGLSVGVAHGTRVDADGKIVAGYPAIINVDAQRKQTRVKLVSETALEAQNNMEATVAIVNQIPVLKSTIEGGSGTARDVIQNIERLDVGIKLKLTPHVIPGGEIQMQLNPSIEAVIDPGPTATAYTPTIARREVSTTVTVPDGETIVIAGLTRQDKTRIVKRVPLLGSLPLIGFLFRSTSDSDQKTNLLIFVTPRIVADRAAAAALTREWRGKTGISDDETP